MENKIDELLTKLKACEEAQNWAKGKTFEEVYTSCHRGDWLCWLFARTNPEDVQLMTLVKGHQANTVRHLMKDERSRKAVDTAIAYGEGKVTGEKLSRAADAAYAATRDAADSADSAEDAAYSAARAARAASYAADVAAIAAAEAAASSAADWAVVTAAARAAAFAASAVSYAARQANRQLTADIFRKYISIDQFKI